MAPFVPAPTLDHELDPVSDLDPEAKQAQDQGQDQDQDQDQDQAVAVPEAGVAVSREELDLGRGVVTNVPDRTVAVPARAHAHARTHARRPGAEEPTRQLVGSTKSAEPHKKRKNKASGDDLDDIFSITRTTTVATTTPKDSSKRPKKRKKKGDEFDDIFAGL